MTPRIKYLLNKLHSARQRNKWRLANGRNERIRALKIQSLLRLGSQHFWKSVDQVTHRKTLNNTLVRESFDPNELMKPWPPEAYENMLETH